jgi:hypothetical protein
MNRQQFIPKRAATIAFVDLACVSIETPLQRRLRLVSNGTAGFSRGTAEKVCRSPEVCPSMILSSNSLSGDLAEVMTATRAPLPKFSMPIQATPFRSHLYHPVNFLNRLE